MKKIILLLCIAIVIPLAAVSCGPKAPSIDSIVSDLKYEGEDFTEKSWLSEDFLKDMAELADNKEFEDALIKELNQMTRWDHIYGFAAVLDLADYKSESFKNELWSKMKNTLDSTVCDYYDKKHVVQYLEDTIEERPEILASSLFPFDEIKDYFHENGKHLSKSSGYYSEHADQYTDSKEWIKPKEVEAVGGTLKYCDSREYEIHGDFLFETYSHFWELMDADNDFNDYMFYCKIRDSKGEDLTLVQYDEKSQRSKSKKFKASFASSSEWYVIEYANSYGSDALALMESGGQIAGFIGS